MVNCFPPHYTRSFAMATLTSCGCFTLLNFSLLALFASSAHHPPTDQIDDGRTSSPYGTVLELTDGTFDAAIAKYDYLLVDFYAPWCGHCRMLSPELDAAAPRLAEITPPIAVAKINADKYTKLASKYKISAYPTLKFFINGFPIDYTGPRKAVSLVSHLQKSVGPDVSILSTESELNEFLQTAGNSLPLFIGFGLQEYLLSEIAKKHKSKAWFAVVENFSERSMVDYDFDRQHALVVQHPQYQEQGVFYGPFEGDDMEEFVQQSLLPLVNSLNIDSIKLLKEDGRPIALAILRDASSEDSVSYIKNLKAAAPGNRAFVFAYMDAVVWPDFAETFYITERSVLPVFVIWDGGSEFFSSVSPHEFSQEKSEFHFVELLQEYKDGKAVRNKVKRPSFMEFVTSNITVKTVYVLVFIVATIMFLQNLSGSNTTETDNSQAMFSERGDKKDQRTNRSSKLSDSDTSIGDLKNDVDTVNKED